MNTETVRTATVTGGLLNVGQVAQHLGCSPRGVMAWTKKGDLRAVRLGRLVRYTPEDVAAFIAKNREGS